MHKERKVAIVGAEEADEIGIVPGKSALMLQAEAARNALRDAGLSFADVDGVFTTGFGTGWAPSMSFAEYVGIVPRYTDSTATGGSAFVIMVEHALAALELGLCNVALIVHGENGYSGRHLPRPSRVPDPWTPAGQFEAPFGAGGPAGMYAMAAMRHMAVYGTTSEQLAEVAVSTRRWAQLNPKALKREPLTVADVLASRWIAYPLHLLDCCLVTDAGGAVVLTTAVRARDCRKPPVWVLGTGEAHTHNSLLGMPDLTVSPARISGELALTRAGVSRDEIDLLEIYDSFTYTVIVTLESLGFCGPGEGGPFVENGRLGPGGALPTNTSGGGLSYTHSGMFGIFLLIEAVRQLRGECGARQVPNARLALCNGTGGFLSSSGTVILGRD